MNCEKNAVVCEGYPEKQIWKSGREKAEEGTLTSCRCSPLVLESNRKAGRIPSHSLLSITMPPIFHGLETVEDRIFWKHYNEHLSTVLTVEGEHKNAFKDMVIPMAVKYRPLMHSILSLASKHIDFDTPYGINLLKNNPTTTIEDLQERSLYHYTHSRSKFYDEEVGDDKSALDSKALTEARYAQMLCFLLEASADGNPRGEHRLHLHAYRSLIADGDGLDDSPFSAFVGEFFRYHLFADELIYSVINPNDPSTRDMPPPPPLPLPRLLGVTDGLLDYLSQITAIRNTIRGNMLARIDPVVDYVNLYRATEIDGAIRDWIPHWPPGDSRERVGLLYKQMLWIYLVRTIWPPSSSASSSMASSAISLPPVHNSPAFARSASSAVNTPPQSAATSCASSPKLTGFGSGHGPGPIPQTSKKKSRQGPQSRQGSVAEATARIGEQTNEDRADSPPPIRQPSEHDPRITLAVDESLAILDTFKPSDPSQVLLLLPCFIIGTACVTPSQQDRIRTAIKTVRGYTGMRNTNRAMEVLEELWKLMDAGQWLAVWDWAGVVRGLNLDFNPV